jgi:hypothetical protein
MQEACIVAKLGLESESSGSLVRAGARFLFASACVAQRFWPRFFSCCFSLVSSSGMYRCKITLTFGNGAVVR